MVQWLFFCSGGYDASEQHPDRLYNPHLVFSYLRRIQDGSTPEPGEESNATHSIAVLKSISINDLTDLVHGDAIPQRTIKDFGFADLLGLENRFVTWTLLFFFGVVTYGPLISGKTTVQIPNESVRRQVCISNTNMPLSLTSSGDPSSGRVSQA
jgi:hypothetical protein